MQADIIIKRIKETLPKYTNAFMNSVNVSSLVKSGNVATVTTSTPNSLSVGDEVTIAGAKIPVTVDNLTQVNGVGLAITSSETRTIAGETDVEISGADQSEYNGVKTNISQDSNLLKRDIVSFTVSGNIATITTKQPHGFILDNRLKIKITGVKNVNLNHFEGGINSIIDANSFTINLNSSPNNPNIILNNAYCSGLVGSNNFFFEVDKQATTPATGTISLLTYDNNIFNGLKIVNSVVDVNNFTYLVEDDVSNLAVGNIKARYSYRITEAPDLSLANKFYRKTKNENDNWLFVVINSETLSRNEKALTDAVTENPTGTDYRETNIVNFTVYCFMSNRITNDSDATLMATTLKDARNLKAPLYKSLVGFQPESELSEGYLTINPISNQLEEIAEGSYLIYSYEFEAMEKISEDDIIDRADYFRIKSFEFDIINNNYVALSGNGAID